MRLGLNSSASSSSGLNTPNFGTVRRLEEIAEPESENLDHADNQFRKGKITAVDHHKYTEDTSPNETTKKKYTTGRSAGI
jgi:hypothetical protein